MFPPNGWHNLQARPGEVSHEGELPIMRRAWRGFLPISNSIYAILVARKKRDKGFVRLMPWLEGAQEQRVEAGGVALPIRVYRNVRN